MNGLDTIVDFINSNREWLIYVPTMLFVLILFIWTFVGFIRGSRRSSYAFLMMVIAIAVSAGIYFYLYPNGGANAYSLMTSVGLNPEQLFNVKFPEPNLLSGFRALVLEQVAQQNGGIQNITIEMYPYINVMAESVLKLGVFLVCLVLYFAILLILNVFYFLFFRNKKYKRKLQYKGKVFRKRRFIGGFVGLCRGFIVAIISFSFLGAGLIAATGGKEAKKGVTFNDPTLSNIYDLNNFAKELGSTGIFKVLNGVQDKNNNPYYLFISNSILSGNIGDDNYKLTEQFQSFTGLANDLIDLIAKYGGKDISYDIITGNNPEEAEKILVDLFNNQDFNNELIEIIDKYEGTEYIKNLFKASTGSLIKNYGLIMAEKNPELEKEFMGFYDTLFSGVEGIKPDELVTFEDVKTVFKAVVSSGNELLELAEYSKNGDKSRKITFTNKILNVYDGMFDYLDDLSMFNINDTAKDKNYSKLIDNAISFTFSIVKDANGKPLENPFKEANIKWTTEFKGLVMSVNNISNISEEMYQYQTTNQELDLKTVSAVFKEDYKNREIIDKNYDSLVDLANQFSSVNYLLNSDLFYSQYEKMMNATLQSTEFKMPRTLKWANQNGVEGELSKVLNIFRKVLRNGALDEILDDIKFTDLNTIKKLINSLNKIDGNQTVLENFVESDFIHYTLSQFLVLFKNDSIKISVPSECYEVIDGVNIITKDEIKNLVNVVPVVLNEIPDLNVIKDDPLVFVDALQKDTVKDKVISSNVLSATASETVYNLYLNNSSLSQYIYIPKKLAFTNENRDTAMKSWIGNGGELDKLLSSLKFVDVRGLMNNDQNAIIKITEISRPNFDILVDSLILKTSFPKILNTLSTEEFKIMIPSDSLSENNEEYQIIENEELYTMLVAANKILFINETTNKIDYNLNNILPNKDSILESTIISASIVEVILTNPNATKFLSVPSDLKTVDYNNFKQSLWMTNYLEHTNELNKMFETFNVFEIKLDDVINGNLDTNKIINKVLTLDEQYNNTTKTKLETICESKVLHLTLSNTLETNPDISKNVIVPDNAIIDLTSPDRFIKVNELANLIAGVKGAFEFDANTDLIQEFNNLEQLIAKLFTGDFSAKKNQLLTSYILEETIIIKVNEYFIQNPNDMLIIPTFLSLNNYEAWHSTRLANDSLGNPGELSNLLEILAITKVGELFGKPNFNEELNKKLNASAILYTEADSLSLNAETIKNEKVMLQDAILKSFVVNSTVIKTLNDQAHAGSGIYMPEAYKFTNIKEEFTKENIWLKNKEINSMFSALNELRLPIVENSINVEINGILNKNYDTNLLLSSKVIWFTLSNNLLNNETLYFDSSDVLDNITAKTELYITNNEIDNLLNSVKVLADNSGNIDINNIKISNVFANYEQNVDRLLNSSTLKVTLIKVLSDALSTPGANLTIPVELRYEFADHIVNILGNEALERYTLVKNEYGYNELRNILDVVNALNLAEKIDNKEVINLDINQFLTNSTNSLEQNELALKNQDTILKSLLVSASITDIIASIQGLEIPTKLKEEAAMMKTNGRYTNSLWLSNNEIKNLFTALGVLDIQTHNNSFAIDPNSLINLLTKENITKVHTSSIVYKVLSDSIIDNVKLNMFIPLNVLENYSKDYEDKVIKTTELFNLTNGVKALFGDNFGSEITLPTKENVDMILLSDILHMTISREITKAVNSFTILETQKNVASIVDGLNNDKQIILNKDEVSSFVKTLLKINTNTANNKFTIEFKTTPNGVIEDLKKLDASNLESVLVNSILSNIITSTKDNKAAFKYVYDSQGMTNGGYVYKQFNTITLTNETIDLNNLVSSEKEYITKEDFLVVVNKINK